MVANVTCVVMLQWGRFVGFSASNKEKLSHAFCTLYHHNNHDEHEINYRNFQDLIPVAHRQTQAKNQRGLSKQKKNENNERTQSEEA